MTTKKFEFVGGSRCGQSAIMHERTKSIFDESFGWYVVGKDGRLWHNDKMTQNSIKRRAQFRGELENE
jgi:hypothetical protein